MIHTERGKELLELIKDDIYICPAKASDMRQPNLYNPTKLSDFREEFWANYDSNKYIKSTDKYYNLVDRAKLVYNYLLRRK